MDKIAKVKNEVKLKMWSETIKVCTSSGLTVSEWCRNNGINVKTYYYRLRKVSENLCEIKECQNIVAVNFPEEIKSDSKITIKASGITVGNPSPSFSPYTTNLFLIN